MLYAATQNQEHGHHRAADGVIQYLYGMRSRRRRMGMKRSFMYDDIIIFIIIIFIASSAETGHES
jgi:hypothetical protein